MDNLTPHMKNILKLLALGNSYKDIAGKLVVSEHTIRNTVQTIYNRLNVQNAQEASIIYINYIINAFLINEPIQNNFDLKTAIEKYSQQNEVK